MRSVSPFSGITAPFFTCCLLWLGLAFPGLAGCSLMDGCIVLLFLLAEHAMYASVAGMLRVSAGGCVVAAAGGCVAWGAVLRVKKRQRVRESFWGVAVCRARRAKADRLWGKALTISINVSFTMRGRIISGILHPSTPSNNSSRSRGKSNDIKHQWSSQEGCSPKQ